MVGSAPFGPGAWFLPLALTAVAGRSIADLSEIMAGIGPERAEAPTEIPWVTPNEIVAETTTMRLRRFGGSARRRPLLVAAPFALHDAGIADIAAGHSLVATLSSGGRPIMLTEWRSARPDLAGASIDTYLADLFTAANLVGSPVDLVGLCQGGWMALMLAALFPGHVRRLAIVGAPVDMHAGGAGLAPVAASTPPEVITEIIRLGGGVVPGARVLDLWLGEPGDRKAARAGLQIEGAETVAEEAALAGFFAWYGRTLDLPGLYFRQVFDRLFRENQLAHGAFRAFGRQVDIRRVTVPLIAVAGEVDPIAPPEQVLAATTLVGTPAAHLRRLIVPGCGHLELYMGRRVLRETWPEILAFLA